MKIQTAFRLDKTLLDELKEKAKSQRRSLNNYIEFLLYKSVGHIPNQETIDAIEAARTEDLEHIDNLNAWLDNL